MSEQSQNALKNFIAGGFAGATEATIFYPTEFVKTQMQLQGRHVGVAEGGAVVATGPIALARETIRSKGIFGLYNGLSTLVVGTFFKNAVRFAAFNQFRSMLVDENGKLTASRSALVCGAAAGSLTGVTEALIAVTPTETIKTKLIHDQWSKTPKYKGMVHGVRVMLVEEGVRGIYKGATPTVMRQAANSAIRFTVYGAIKDRILEGRPKGVSLSTWESFAAGIVAGTVNVYATQPLDVLKTRMQGLEAHKYKNTYDCARSILSNEGILTFWRGSVPRFSRVGFSGGVVFASFEAYMRVINSVWPDSI